MNDSLFAVLQRRLVDHWYAPAELGADDRRLALSGIPVFLVLSLLFGTIYTDRINPFLYQDIDLIRKARTALRENAKSKVYPVLIQQKYAPKPESDQFRALSDVTAEGTGGITEREGFHTLTPHDVMDPGAGGTPSAPTPPSPASRQPAEAQKERQAERKRPGEGLERKKPVERRRPEAPVARPSQPGRGQTGEDYKIPANYRFEQDFALRYDSSRRLSIARQELAGFSYFQRMLRQIGQSWSLPGAIYAYRDQYGRVSNQPVPPQVVKVLFALDPDGRVRDVRVVASLNMKKVDESCMSALRGQNFGPPPPEVLERGNIFGINFVIPNVMGR